MKSLLGYITEDIPKRDKGIHKRDEYIPKIDKEIDKDMSKIDKDTNKEDMPKIDEDITKRDIINNENKVDDFRRAVSSIGFKRIKVYRF